MKLYTTREATERLGVTPHAIVEWIKRGKFPNAYKLDPEGITSPFRIPEKDIIAFEEKRRMPQPEAAEQE